MLKPELAEQYAALATGVVVAPLERSQVVMSGRDRATLLHKFCTQDILAKQPGEGGEAFLCNVQGKIVAYVYFFVSENEIYLDSAPDQAEKIIAHLDRYVITEDVKFRDATTEMAEWLIAGPEAASALEHAGIPAPIDAYRHLSVTLGEVPIYIRRVPFGGANSFFLGMPAGSADSIIARLDQQGAMRCGPEVVEIARVESGTPLYGIDITIDNLPQEVARDAEAIHFRKGCYLGQETVARIDALGHVNKLLVGVKFDAETPVAPGHELKLGDKTVGRVTSAAWSPRFQALLALAYVRREHATPGTRLEGAEVVSLGPLL